MVPLLSTILLATDGSQGAEEAGRAALALADLTGADLHVVHVWNVPQEHTARAVAASDQAYAAGLHEEHARAALARAVSHLEEAGGTLAGVQLIPGRPGSAIAEEAATVGADLIVTGSRGTGQAKRVLLGSVAEEIVRQAGCPVLVVRGEQGTWPPAQVIVGADSSPESQRAMELAAGIAATTKADLTLLRAVPGLPLDTDPTAPAAERTAQMQADLVQRTETALQEQAAALKARFAIQPNVQAVVEDPDMALLHAAEAAGDQALIAVGTRGTAPAGQLWLGSTALRVLTCALGPVLICPHRAVSEQQD